MAEMIFSKRENLPNEYPGHDTASEHSILESGKRNSIPCAVSSQHYKVIDIRNASRNSSSNDLRTLCLQGLTQPQNQKYLPSLLLWDEKGPELYDKILSTQYYYPLRVESNLLEQRAQQIANCIKSSHAQTIIELGAGNMQKTSTLLHALGATGIKLRYYALDVDQKELEASMSGLVAKIKPQFPNISLYGLLGTYEDCAIWITSAQEVCYSRMALVWLGNSIANLLPGDASRLLWSFIESQTPKTFAGFLIAVDGCKDQGLIECAYDTPGGQSRAWIKYALQAARVRLGPEAVELLDDDNWRVEGGWDAQSSCYESWLSAARPLSATVEGRPISLQRGEKVFVLRSGKWSKDEVSEITKQHDLLEVKEWWNSAEVDYGIYWIQYQ